MKLSLSFWIPILCASPALAQPAPKLNSVSPEWVQRGASATLNFTGENLGRVERFLISGDNWISLTNAASGAKPPQIEASAGGLTASEIRDDKKIGARLAVAPKAALGQREVRAVTPDGVSNPLVIHIGLLPEISQSPNNTSLTGAQTISLPAVVSGAVRNASETDYYRFSAKKGQDLTIEVAAARIGSPLDSSLALLDSTGKELARSEDALGLDSLIFFSIPADGEYYAALHDFRFQGGPAFVYRLNIGALPFVTSFFPLGAQRGQDVEIQLQGHNLGSVSKLNLHIEPNAPLGRQELRAHAELGVSNPFPFEISDLPNLFEKEPNNTADQANVVPVPVAINGRIDSKHDHDAFKFKAAKGQQLVFEVEASRFGSPLDPVLTLTDAQGKVLQQNDDAAGADARIVHQFTEAGDFVILIDDLLQRFGNDFVYRLTITAPQPEFAVRFSPDTPRIHRGGHFPIQCELSRISGFNEIVEITLDNPPPGIFAEPLVLLPNGPLTGTLFLAASEQAALGSALLHLRATTRLNGHSVVRQLQPHAGANPVSGAFLTVLPTAPFQIRLATLSADLHQNESATLSIVADRQNGFNSDINISAEGFTAGADNLSKSFQSNPITLKKTEAQANLQLQAKLDSDVGTRPVYLKGEAVAAGQTITEYSHPVPISIQQVPFVLTTALKRISVTALPPSSGSAANEASFTVKAERRSGFNGPIHLVLKGTPPGVTATLTDISENSPETSVKIVASDKAVPAKEIDLVLTANAQFQDRIYRQVTAPVQLTISAPDTTPIPSLATKK